MSKTKNKKKFRLNPFAVVAIVLCALIVIYCGTTAWITGGAPLNPIRFTQLQDFSYDIDVEGATLDADGVITFDSSTINNISQLKVKIKETGNGVAYTRIRVSHEWLRQDGSCLQGDLSLPIKLSESFYDNRAADGYIYHKGTLQVNEWIDFIVGFDLSSFDTSAFSNTAYEGLKLRIDVYVDAVQFNRYRQIWGIDGLPWRNANA